MEASNVIQLDSLLWLTLRPLFLKPSSSSGDNIQIHCLIHQMLTVLYHVCRSRRRLPLITESRRLPREKNLKMKLVKKRVLQMQRSTSHTPHCAICETRHSVHSCSELQALPVSNRVDKVKFSSLCFNCLSREHMVSNCSSNGGCKRCISNKHEGSWGMPNALGLAVSGALQLRCRAQLDSGAMISLVSSKLANTIKAERLRGSSTAITGVGRDIHITHAVEFQLNLRVQTTTLQ